MNQLGWNTPSGYGYDINYSKRFSEFKSDMIDLLSIELTFIFHEIFKIRSDHKLSIEYELL
jgi:hypothetical protein